jgi:hypothetical protein
MEGMVDLSVDSVSPVQVLEGQSLVRNKATAVKAVIRKTGNGTANNVSARLDYGSLHLNNFFVAEPSNLNWQNALIDDNISYPLNFAANEITKTLYFFDNGLAPSGGVFEASVTVDHLNTAPETNEANNTGKSPLLPVYDANWSGERYPNLSIQYFRTDWGTTPLLAFNSYFQASNDFLRGVYPVSAQRFAPDKSSIFVGDTTRFRWSNGKLDERGLVLWVFTTLPQMRLAHPTADRFIATVPAGWFASNTKGKLTDFIGVTLYPNMRDLVVTEARTTNRPDGPSIAGHELGHSYGLDVSCEEYDSCNTSRQDNIGNYASPGLWVDKRIPIQIPTERQIYCFMGGYADREYWIDADDYLKLLTDHKTAITSQASATATGAILAIGTFDITGTATLDKWYILPDAEPSIPSPGPYTFEYQDAGGALLSQQSFDISFTLGGYTLTQTPFVFTIPYVPNAVKIVVKHNAIPLAQKIISSSAPHVAIISPNGGEQLSGQATVQWSGTDADGDTLSYALLFSSNSGATWESVAINLTETSYTWDISKLAPGTQYLIKIIATDGINTSQDISHTSFTIAQISYRLYLPILTKNP